MMKLRKPNLLFRKKRLLIGSTLMVAFASLVAWNFLPSSTTYAALGNASPMANEVYANNQQGRMSHVMKHETVAEVKSLRLGIYYPATFGSNGSGEFFRIRYSHDNRPKICNIHQQIINQGGRVDITLSSSNQTVVYRVPIANVCNNIGSPIRNNVAGTGNGWQQNKFYANYRLPNSFGQPNQAAGGMYKITATVAYTDNVAQGNVNGIGNNFNFVTSVSQPNAKIGPLGPINVNAPVKSDSFGLRSAHSFPYHNPELNNIEMRTQFGVPCSVADNTFAIKLYDPDPNIFGDIYVWVTENGPNNRLPANRYDSPLAGQNNQHVTWRGNQQAMQVTSGGSGSNAIIWVNNAKKGVTYRVHVRNNNTTPSVPSAPNGNVLSIGLPYDSIYGDVDCEYELTPSTQTSETRYMYHPNILVSGEIEKTLGGPVPENHSWQMYAVRYSSMPNTNTAGESTNGNACAWVPATNRISGCDGFYSGSTNGNANQSVYYSNGGPDPVGTRLCFFTRVQNPTEEEGDDVTWRYSNMVCVVAGIFPRTQVWGYDARVGKVIDTSLRSVLSRSYGSWSEYGLFSGGRNVNMASASGLNTGSSDPAQDQWSNLTFANRSVWGAPQFGYFNGINHPVVSQPTTPAGDPKCNFNPAGTVFPAGAKCVIRITGNLNITGNITYANGPYTNIKDIPRVIIEADSVTISNNVTTIDPWIVANGAMSTCAEARTGSDPFVQKPANITAALCGNRLTFNGAVIAESIYLHRMTPPGVTEDVSGEVFNLRADVFLSTFAGNGNGTIATTDSISELPPRF